LIVVAIAASGGSTTSEGIADLISAAIRPYTLLDYIRSGRYRAVTITMRKEYQI